MNLQADLVQYGGAVFSNRCPKCGVITDPNDDLSVNIFMNDHLMKKDHSVGAKCESCGVVRLPFVGFESALICN